jgi:hypothetical protein
MAHCPGFYGAKGSTEGQLSIVIEAEAIKDNFIGGSNIYIPCISLSKSTRSQVASLSHRERTSDNVNVPRITNSSLSHPAFGIPIIIKGNCIGGSNIYIPCISLLFGTGS